MIRLAGFVGGIAALYYSAQLPPLLLSSNIGLAALLLLYHQAEGGPGGGRTFFTAPWIALPLQLIFGLGLGWSWAAVQAHWQLQTELPHALEGQDLVVIGTVASIPAIHPNRIQFELAVQQLSHQGQLVAAAPRKIRLTQYHPPVIPVSASPFKVGDAWQLQVRLKRPHALLNPGGLDYEYHLLRQGIRATGYIRQVQQRLPQQDAAAWIGRLRQTAYDQLDRRLEPSTTKALVLALALGETSQMTSEHWTILRQTGTSHLLAISGLQVGLVAGLGFWLGRWLWSWLGLGLYWPAPKVGAVSAVLLAVFYAALADFSVSTQRALIMLAVVMGAVLWQRHLQLSQHLRVAFWLVLGFDPLAIADSGFWLSFAAVGFILYTMSGRLGVAGHWWWRWGGRVQWVLSVALIPLLLALFQSASLLSPLANALAVPWINLWLVPLILVVTVLLLGLPLAADSVINGLLWLASLSLEGLWQVLAGLGQWRYALWHQPVPAQWVALLAVLGIVMLWLPRGCVGRWLGAIWVLPLWFYPVAKPLEQEVWLTVLDVGQGLAVLVQTQHHLLVYDTGARRDDFDLGERVVVPAVRATGVAQIDRLVLSHADNDHAGGALAVWTQLPVQQVWSGTPPALPPVFNAQPCQQGQQWQWDGVSFAVLHPSASDTWPKRNNYSCVLRITSPYGTVLLPGDIEQAVEQQLLQQKMPVAADVVVAPHHGSKTSSTPEFIAAMAPQAVIFSTGYRNQYHFPHPVVVSRYQQQGAQLWDTAKMGAIRVRLTAQGQRWEAIRQMEQRYWRED